MKTIALRILFGVFWQKWAICCGLFLVLCSCDSANAPDCFQTAGETERFEVELAPFTQITVFENLNLVVKQGEVQKVVIESGENLLSDISAVVEGDRLIIRNDNSCNLFRDDGLSTVFVTSPDIRQIRSSTAGLISSDGALSYPALSLVSESFNEPEAVTTDGSFDLDVNTQSLAIVVNGIAYFKLRGQTEAFNITVAAGDSRIEAQELQAQQVSLNHRGTNDIFVDPRQRISGVIRGYGDVISSNRPPIIEVEELFRGRLLFRN